MARDLLANFGQKAHVPQIRRARSWYVLSKEQEAQTVRRTVLATGAVVEALCHRVGAAFGERNLRIKRFRHNTR